MGSYAFLPFSSIFSVPLDINLLIMTILGVISIIQTIVYIRIFLVARRHKNQIQIRQAQQVTQADEVPNLSSLIKFTVAMFYVYFVSLVCHLRYMILFFATDSVAKKRIYGPNVTLKKFFPFS